MTATNQLPGRTAVPLLTAGYGIVVIIANARNDVLTNDFTRRWVLFDGGSDFPADFGRNVFAGSVVLGVLIVVLAVVTRLAAGHRTARWPAAAAGLLALAIVLGYRSDGNFLAAKPSAAAVLLAVALYLAASTTAPSPTARTSESA